MKVGSLFSGIGGFDIGFERAGMEVAWQCEIDPHARAVLAKHWPGVPCYDDVRGISAGSVPDVDLICGGFPCQDVSVAGRRAGLAGERSGLWFEFHRVLAELKPPWVVIENVPGLLSSNGGRDMGTVLGGLGDLGYRWAYGVLDAQWFGVAQRRRRVFIVGHLGDGRAAEVLPLPAGLCGDPPSRRKAGEDVAGTLGGSSQGGGFRTTDLDNNGAANPLTATYAKTADNTQGAYPPTLVVHVQSVVAIQDTREMEKAQNGLGVSGEGVGYTLDGTGAQGVYVPEVVRDEVQNLVALGGVRRLTPTECERLQGFPDGWTAGQADSHRYKQLGNAVAVPVAEWIGRRIMAAGVRP